jgi:UDP-sugar pyrophosphorylase
LQAGRHIYLRMPDDAEDPSPSGGLPASAPPALAANATVLDAAEVKLARVLLACGQSHLFKDWDPPGVADAQKHAFFDTLAGLDEAYEGGLSAYIGRARTLLAGRGDPHEHWVPSVPPAERMQALEPGTGRFLEREARGIELATGLGFVVAAGGLGERLGFSGIKLALPCEIATGTSVLEFYCAHILALQRLLTTRLGRTVRLPLCVMTSVDTHEATLALLRDNAHYGLSAAQVTCLRQRRVLSFRDQTGGIALRAGATYEVETKPHGHGDVHALMRTSGLASRWAREGVHWIYFTQDSSALYLFHYLASLGAAAASGYDCAFVASPRKPGESCGILASM